MWRRKKVTAYTTSKHNVWTCVFMYARGITSDWWWKGVLFCGPGCSKAKFICIPTDAFLASREVYCRFITSKFWNILAILSWFFFFFTFRTTFYFPVLNKYPVTCLALLIEYNIINEMVNLTKILLIIFQVRQLALFHRSISENNKVRRWCQLSWPYAIPTDSFTILEPQYLLIDELYVVWICRATNFKALKLLKSRPGTCSNSMVYG